MHTVIYVQFNVLYLAKHLQVVDTLYFHTCEKSIHKLNYDIVHPNSDSLDLDYMKFSCKLDNT